MPSLNTVQGLLMSRDSALIKVMTATMVEAAIATTICTQSERLAELLAENRFSVLVLDCDMAGMSETLGGSSLQHEASRFVIAVAGPAGGKRQMARRHVDVVLTKPVSRPVAKRILRQWAEARRKEAFGPVANAALSQDCYAKDAQL